MRSKLYIFAIMSTTVLFGQGLAWSIVTLPSEATLWEISFINSDVGYAVGENYGTVIKTTDKGETWSASTTVSNEGVRLKGMHISHIDTVWAVGTTGTIVKIPAETTQVTIAQDARASI